MIGKICFAGTEISPSDDQVFVGGHVNTVVRLSKGLSRLGWEVHIVTTPSRFLREAEFDFPWAKIHLIKVGREYGSVKYGADFLIKAVKTIKNLNYSESFNVIHTHSGFFSIATIPVFLKKKLGVPAFHSLYCPASFLPTKVVRGKFAIKILSAGLDKIIAVSNNVKTSLMDCGVSEDKIEIIPLCVDTDVFNSSVSGAETLKLTKENFKTRTVLFVGNAGKVKGLDIFLQAAKLVLRKYQRVKFVITLHEPYETIERVRVMASGKLGSQVAVMGVVRNMPGLIASADVVVVPFRSTRNVSDIPLVVLEAMAVGKPVVASKVGGIAELIHSGENGMLVKPNRVDLLADVITDLLRNSSLREEIGKRASSTIDRNFSYIEVSRKLSGLYQKVMEDSE